MATPSKSARYFLYWLAFFGLLLFAFTLFVWFGVLALFIEQDSSRLSLVILVGLLVASLHAGYRAYKIDDEINRARVIAISYPSHESADQSSIASEYCLLIDKAVSNGRLLTESANLGVYLEKRVHEGHANGWYIADLMIKLGLLGTVIGFIFMLSSVAQLETTDLNAAKLMLTQMSGGMRIALFTTLAGLSSGLILGAQYQLLDHGADRLFGIIVSTAETGEVRTSQSNPAFTRPE